MSGHDDLAKFLLKATNCKLASQGNDTEGRLFSFLFFLFQILCRKLFNQNRGLFLKRN